MKVALSISLAQWRWRRHRSVILRISLAEWRWRRHRSVTGWFERSEYLRMGVRELSHSGRVPQHKAFLVARAPLQGAILARTTPGVLASLTRPGYWVETPSASWPFGFIRFSIPKISQNRVTYFCNFETYFWRLTSQKVYWTPIKTNDISWAITILFSKLSSI